MTRSVGRAGQRGGDRSSKSALFEMFIAERDRLRRIAAGMGLGVADADDVLQDVSIRVVQQSAGHWNCREAVGWLIKVTVNLCLAEHRRRKRFQRAASQILERRSQTEGCSTRADQRAIEAEELEIVREALQELHDSLLTVVVLRYFCGLNSTEIGQALGLSASAVRSRLRDGRMILAGKLMERGIEP